MSNIQKITLMAFGLILMGACILGLKYHFEPTGAPNVYGNESPPIKDAD